MPQKRCHPEGIIAKLRKADVLLGEGKNVPEVVRALGIHEATYYRWRKVYGSAAHESRARAQLVESRVQQRRRQPREHKGVP